MKLRKAAARYGTNSAKFFCRIQETNGKREQKMLNPSRSFHPNSNFDRFSTSKKKICNVTVSVRVQELINLSYKQITKVVFDDVKMLVKPTPTNIKMRNLKDIDWLKGFVRRLRNLSLT
jgi:hypothetical protein